MTAHDLTLADVAICIEIEACLGTLFDMQARRRIVDAYVTGWVTAEDALETMLSLDLLEVS